jgi:hypothetical protein
VQAITATQSPAFNHAEGRLAGFIWQTGEAFATLRADGITLEFPPLDAAKLEDELKRGSGQ